MMQCYPFQLLSLPYAASALEPFIDTKTMELHHDRHLKTYVDNLNHALACYPKLHDWSLEKLICNANQLPLAIRETVAHNAGGVYNHNFYFEGMGNFERKMPEGALRKAIDCCFGSFAQFQTAWKEKALDLFGSGYVWLVKQPCEKLILTTSCNQQSPLSTRQCAILNVDVWEHAYYLKHYNKRADYIDDYFNVIHWEEVEARYRRCGRGMPHK